jgi:quinol monooxygenase YgiN
MRKFQNSPAVGTVARSGLPAICLALATTLAGGSAALAQAGGEAYAVTYVDISPDWVLQGSGLLKQFRDQSRKEAGNVEFSVMQQADRPNRFMMVEGWKDDAAFQAHLKGANASQFNFILEAIRIAPPDRHPLHVYATAPARTGAGSGAVYMVEHIDFMGGDPAFGLAAQPLVKALAEASQKEPGALRYDVYQQLPPRVNHYAVVAVWTDEKAYDAHETADHTKKFRSLTVIPTVPAHANLYDQRLYKPLD